MCERIRKRPGWVWIQASELAYWDKVIAERCGEIADLINDAADGENRGMFAKSCDVNPQMLTQRIEDLLLHDQLEIMIKHPDCEEEEIRLPAGALGGKAEAHHADGEIERSRVRRFVRKVRAGNDTIVYVLSIPVIQLVRRGMIKKYCLFGIPILVRLNGEFIGCCLDDYENRILRGVLRGSTEERETDIRSTGKFGSLRDRISLWEELTRLEQMRSEYGNKGVPRMEMQA